MRVLSNEHTPVGSQLVQYLQLLCLQTAAKLDKMRIYYLLLNKQFPCAFAYHTGSKTNEEKDDISSLLIKNQQKVWHKNLSFVVELFMTETPSLHRIGNHAAFA